MSAIVFKDKVPHWNVTEVTAYPLEINQNGKSTRVNVFLAPYTPAALKEVLQKNTAGYKREKRDVEIVQEDKSIYASLCDDYFVKIGNATGTPEQQKAWLDKRPEIKPSIVECSFGGLRIDRQEDSDESPVLDIGADLSGAVKVYQELFDEAANKTVKVNMAHNYAHPTEAQYRDYRSSRRNRFIRKTSVWTITESHGTLDKLYDAVVTSVDGVLVHGNPCDQQSKSSWVQHIPLWHKLWIVDQIFGEIVEKNG